MFESSSTSKSAPLFPALLSVPFGLIPVPVHSSVLSFALNRIFSQQAQNGDLDFLLGRVITIKIHDMRLTFCLTLSDGRLIAADESAADLVVGGGLYDLLLLATAQEDPDTLFFQRRLQLDGDTELGLYVKNFLNSQDPREYLPIPLQLILPHLAPLYGRFFGGQ